MTRKYRDGWNDPPPAEVPKDFDVYGIAPQQPTGAIYKPRRTLRRALTAGALAGATGFTYAIMPIAFALGGAAIGIWWIAADFREWLARRRVDADA